jgi:hypothetical protein
MRQGLRQTCCAYAHHGLRTGRKSTSESTEAKRRGRVIGVSVTKGRARQNPPEETPATRYVRVIHPHHPLVGQFVQVVRQAGHSAYNEQQWIIKLADQTCASIPLSWAVPVTVLQQVESFTVASWPDGLWADAASLLELAKMVQYLTTDKLEEVLHYEPFCGFSPSARKFHVPAEAGCSFTELETVIQRMPAGGSDRTGDDVDQTAGRVAQRATGGE